MQGSDCEGFMSDNNGIYCCNEAPGQITNTYIVCDLNNDEIVIGVCSTGHNCQVGAKGVASCN